MISCPEETHLFFFDGLSWAQGGRSTVVGGKLSCVGRPGGRVAAHVENDSEILERAASDGDWMPVPRNVPAEDANGPIKVKDLGDGIVSIDLSASRKLVLDGRLEAGQVRERSGITSVEQLEYQGATLILLSVRAEGQAAGMYMLRASSGAKGSTLEFVRPGAASAH
jgi:hypothetical protein